METVLINREIEVNVYTVKLDGEELEFSVEVDEDGDLLIALDEESVQAALKPSVRSALDTLHEEPEEAVELACYNGLATFLEELNVRRPLDLEAILNVMGYTKDDE